MMNFLLRFCRLDGKQPFTGTSTPEHPKVKLQEASRDQLKIAKLSLTAVYLHGLFYATVAELMLDGRPLPVADFAGSWRFEPFAIAIDTDFLR